MHPERFAFVVLQSLMGMNELQIANELSRAGIATTEGDILTITSSQLFQSERDKIYEKFRTAAVRSAGDILIVATSEAAEHLRFAMRDFTLKPNMRLKAAIEILDHVPETSKTLRQYVSVSAGTAISPEAEERMISRLARDAVRTAKAVEELTKEKEVYRESLQELINVK